MYGSTAHWENPQKIGFDQVLPRSSRVLRCDRHRLQVGFQRERECCCRVSLLKARISDQLRNSTPCLGKYCPRG
jgi:hypothetical protein